MTELVRLTIDGQPVQVPRGTTILQAARRLGLDIPTLCYLDGLKPLTSCLVCTVKVIENGRSQMKPSCGTPVSEGMIVESETAEVAHVRRTALELLLSTHLGDCFAPCYFACPAHMDIPSMLRQIDHGELAQAIATIKQDIALPATLGWVCSRPCEKGCRRNTLDSPLTICRLKRFVAEWDLARDTPFLPECRPATGRAVAIVGAGPAGLSAAYYLRQAGHRVVMFDALPVAGGRLRRGPDPGGEPVPPEVLDGEIGVILRLGIDFRSETPLVPEGTPGGVTLSALRNEFDAVLLCFGEQPPEVLERLQLPFKGRGLIVDRETYQTPREGIFAAGNAIRGRGLAIRSAADGKAAARSIDQFLREGCVSVPPEVFAVRIGRLEKEELSQLAVLTDSIPRQEPAQHEAWDQTIAAEQARRCLHCDCRALPFCRLREYAERYGADTDRFRGDRPKLQVIARPSGILFEPGKCILCGICVEITEAARAPLGLTFIGRGFDIRIGVPFNRSLDEALGELAERVVAACPTGALAFRDGKPSLTLPILDVASPAVPESL